MQLQAMPSNIIVFFSGSQLLCANTQQWAFGLLQQCMLRGASIQKCCRFWQVIVFSLIKDQPLRFFFFHIECTITSITVDNFRWHNLLLTYSLLFKIQSLKVFWSVMFEFLCGYPDNADAGWLHDFGVGSEITELTKALATFST